MRLSLATQKFLLKSVTKIDTHVKAKRGNDEDFEIAGLLHLHRFADVENFPIILIFHASRFELQTISK